MPFLTLGGATLRYDRAGAGPTVLLIHGWLGNRSFWERQVAALRDRFTVVTVDLRGHGESSPPRAGYTLAGMAADMEQLVRAIGAQRVAIVGWSMGGMIAQELARLGDRTTGLVLVGTTAGGLTDPKNAHANQDLATQLRAGVKDDFRGFVRTFAASLFKAGAASPLLAWATGQMQRTPPHVAEACLDAVLTSDLRDKLSALKVPTLVVHGRHDALFPFATAEELKKGIAGAQLVAFEESGHSPHLEEPERFNEVVGAFLGATGGGATAKPAVAPKPAAATPTAPAPKPATKAAAPAPAKQPEKPAAKKPVPPPKKPEKKKPAKPAAKKPAKRR